MRKAAKYWALRSRTEFQPAMTTTGVRKVVSMISGIEKPSTPRKYSTLNAVIHGIRSTNCMSAVEASNPVHSGTLMTKVATETARVPTSGRGHPPRPAPPCGSSRGRRARDDRQPDQHAQHLHGSVTLPDGPATATAATPSSVARPMIIAKA
jgi:hypothetical protein